MPLENLPIDSAHPHSRPARTHPPGPLRQSLLVFCGLTLLASCFALFLNSQRLSAVLPQDGSLLHIFVGIEIAVAGLWLACVFFSRRQLPRFMFLFVMLTGLLCRAILIPAPPVLSTDFNRYLWDGALICHGQSPWSISPAAAIQAGHTLTSGGQVTNSALRSAGLAANESPAIMRRINHANLPTIYPPVSEAVFAFAALIQPFGIAALKAVYLAIDCATALLLLAILRQLRLPSGLIIVYWWNPIVINSFFNQAHMDLITFPFLLLAVLLAMKGRTNGSLAPLALAAGAKFWPVVLAPLFVQAASNSWRRRLAGLVVFFVCLMTTLLPMLLSHQAGTHSLLAYGRYWHENDGLFRLESLFWHGICGGHRWLGLPAGLWARLTTAGLFCLFAAWLLRGVSDAGTLIRKSGILIGALFLLSPTQFPWYYTWMLVFLTIVPTWSLLAYSVTLPLYSLHNTPSGMVWLEHLPIFSAIAMEYWWWRQALHDQPARIAAAKCIADRY